MAVFPSYGARSPKGLCREWCRELDCLSLWYLNRRGAACCALLGVRGLVGQGKPCPYEDHDPMHTVRRDPTGPHPAASQTLHSQSDIRLSRDLFNEDGVMHLFHPLVARWFRTTFGTPTDPQAAGWTHIAAGEDTLIAAPTGSGKTLAAFLWAIDGLVQAAAGGTLEDRTYVV